MMELELKHVQSYPIGDNGIKVYALKQRYKSFNGVEIDTSTFTVTGIQHSDDNVYISLLGINGFYLIDDFKLILKPLSDLITDEEEPIASIINICDNYCDAYYEWMEIYIDNPTQEKIMQAPQEVFNELLKQHYDVYNLIPNNLAIDINTIS